MLSTCGVAGLSTLTSLDVVIAGVAIVLKVPSGLRGLSST